MAGAKALSPSLTFRGPEGPRFHPVCCGRLLLVYRLPRLTSTGKSTWATKGKAAESKKLSDPPL
jgi:hypothetical protein